MNFKRNSGILLHITSLPSPYGIGTFGKEARDFVDFLSETKTKYWQILPLGPTGYGDSPYQTFSAFACNPLFLDLDNLVEKGLLKKDELPDEMFPEEIVDFGPVIKNREYLIKLISERFDSADSEFITFCVDNSNWLDDYANYTAFKSYFEGKPWYMWEHDIKMRDDDAVSDLKMKLIDEVSEVKIVQFLLYKQWNDLKNYANTKGIEIIGDIPIFVSSDCSDVWANPEVFQLDENFDPIKVAGVPPDYFSATGQLWGNPLYNWDKMREDNYSWWVERFRFTLDWVDVLRIDHFRGFDSCWAIPYGEETAINGQWEKSPGKEIFLAVQNKLGELPIIAEDLGIVTEEVTSLKNRFNFPGMKILQFAFDSDGYNPYLPHNYHDPCIVYTGTHDNDTTIGWYYKLKANVKDFIDSYLHIEDDDNVCQKIIEAAWESNAVISLIPFQDLLCLDSDARMNTPGHFGGNWKWRLKINQLKDEHRDYLTSINQEYGRINN